jgi:hypothetical protein
MLSLLFLLSLSLSFSLSHILCSLSIPIHRPSTRGTPANETQIINATAERTHRVRVTAGAGLSNLRHQHVFARQEAQDARQEVDAHPFCRPRPLGIASCVVGTLDFWVGMDEWRNDVLIGLEREVYVR